MEHAHGTHEKPDKHARLVERLRLQRDDVRRMTSGLDEQAMTTRAVSGKWSSKELVVHLTCVQQLFGRRIEAMLEHDNPVIAPYDPDGDPEFAALMKKPASEILTNFFNSRDWLAQRLEGLLPAQWHRPGRHPEYTHYDVHFQVEYMIHHEGHHLYQLYQRRAPLGKMPH